MSCPRSARNKGQITMTTFTIDTHNNITAHATPEEAAAATTTPFDSFSSQPEFAELAKSWPAKRLVEYKPHWPSRRRAPASRHSRKVTRSGLHRPFRNRRTVAEMCRRAGSRAQGRSVAVHHPGRRAPAGNGD